MRFRLFTVLVVMGLAALAACAPENMAQYWRPISEPNLQMPLAKAQKKLEFDLSQCHCGIFPLNTTHSEAVEFQPDKQRLAATSVTIAPDEANQCMQQPSLIVTECMRARGWEVTTCSGRMPLPGGGSLCAGYVLDNP